MLKVIMFLSCLNLYHERNKGIQNPILNFKGFMVGNAVIDDYNDYVGTFEYWWTHGLISDATFKTLNIHCDLEVSEHASDECNKALDMADAEQGNIDPYSIFTPTCSKAVSRRRKLRSRYVSSPPNGNVQIFPETVKILEWQVHLALEYYCLLGATGTKTQPHGSTPTCPIQINPIISSFIFTPTPYKLTTFDFTQRRMSIAYDPCTQKHSAVYFNLPEVQKALHANVTGIPYRWETCSDIIGDHWKDSPRSMLLFFLSRTYFCWYQNLGV
ncbi:hypothetical protein IFM89_013244 [Coptis chinensis]|uniref:Uncharacterized protein n=1 Tax=Coptis chinensis TaxID=261450 RepID=A0A835INQ4_9MAGN|nr:hypothetical protein IFM89_013244 [Coptis chinensis]